MDLKNREGQYFVTKEDYHRLHEIKNIWKIFHSKYFSGGREVAKIEKLFNEMGKVDEISKAVIPDKPKV